MKKGKDQIIDGVCSGLSESLGFKDPFFIRLVFALGGFVWLYIICMIIMEEPDSEK